MHEHSKKPTLQHLRTLFPFEVPALAHLAGVETDAVYSALQHIPILKQDAIKIISALSQHTRLTLSFEQLDITIWEDFLVLWVVRASAHEPPPANQGMVEKYHLVYAQDQQQATAQAQLWLQRFPHLPYASFTACPQGLTVGDIVVSGRRQRVVDE